MESLASCCGRRGLSEGSAGAVTGAGTGVLDVIGGLVFSVWWEQLIYPST